MTDSLTLDSSQAQNTSRKAGGNPGRRSNQMNFNPLHPSMELPPEQLIRLMGLESKKTRKQQKSSPQPGDKPRRQSADTQPAEEPVASIPVSDKPAKPQRPLATKSKRYAREVSDIPGFSEKRRGLLIPSIVAVLVAGLVVSGYLFWQRPSSVAVQETGVPATPVPASKPQPKKQPVQQPAVTPARPQPKAVKAPPVTRPAAPPAGMQPAAPAPAIAPVQTVNEPNSAEWQAAIDAEQARLREAAQQRLQQQLVDVENMDETQAASLPEPDATLPATEPEDAMPADPVNDEQPPLDTTASEPEAVIEIPQVTAPEQAPAAEEMAEALEQAPVLETEEALEPAPVQDPESMTIPAPAQEYVPAADQTGHEAGSDGVETQQPLQQDNTLVPAPEDTLPENTIDNVEPLQPEAVDIQASDSNQLSQPPVPDEAPMQTQPLQSDDVVPPPEG
jgi:hypothetical protein